MNSSKKKWTVVAVVCSIAILMIWLFSPSDKKEGLVIAEFEAVTNITHKNTYDKYLSEYDASKSLNQTIRIEAKDFAKTTGDGFYVAENLEGLNGSAVVTPEEGSIEWDVNVQEAGLYNIRIHYYPLEGKSSAIERELKINGKIPFSGADILMFDRIWGNRSDQILRDDRDNDIRPRQVEKPAWIVSSFSDSDGYYDEPYQFYLDKGTQNIMLTSLREPMAIEYIELYQEPKLATYEEIKLEYEAQELTPALNQYIVVQAEEAKYKSSPTLYPVSDRSSPTVQPYSVSKIRVNTIGGVNWKLPGQWIEWEFEVEEDGLYQIALKQKQNELRGIFATRSLMIDGQYPFEEMKRVRFEHDRDWVNNVLGDKDEPYLFHLTKGKHSIRMTVSLGDMGPLLRTIESSVLQLNEMYRRVLMITSNKPDPYRDYQLEKRIPNMVEVFKEQAETITEVAEYLEKMTGERSDKVSVLYSMVRQLEEMVDAPETVAKRLDAYKINVGALGTWILTVQQQPISLDYLVISTPEKTLPRAQAKTYEKLIHEAGAFVASYTEDYDSIGNVAEHDEAITVWVTTGRDQAQVIKGLIDDTFTPTTNVSVNLRLVPPNILLPATLAGEGPDVSMQIGEDTPVNYAMRGAAADLSQFADFEEVTQRFRDSALEPYKYGGGVFALPEQQSFPMLFYRKDILAELGLQPPKTWQEIYNMISVLQKHNMEFYLPIEAQNASLVPNATFAMLLFQNGGEFYRNDDKLSALDSEIAMDAFKVWSRFYTSYKFPLQADFPNRFRIGEMPIGIADYTTYNMLTVMAPEIKGLWEFTTVPGTEQADGTINNEVASTTTAVMMLNNSQSKNAAWEFLKWWTSKDTQISYGREMEGLMGEAARYPTANIEALEELPWPVKDYNNLERQWQWVRGIPQVPGGYFTGRHLDNAFRRVVNANQNPRESLSDYILYINDEIEIKRKEFNLPY